jgi:uncharacterized protein (TIGR03067 family)
MRKQSLIAMACVVLLTAVRAEEKAADGDQQKLQGTWEMVSGQRGGKPIPDDVLKKTTIVIAGNKMTLKRGEQATEMTFKLDPTKKPKAIDVDMEGKEGKGIYMLDGDTLKIAHGELGDPRPKDFSSPEGSNWTVVVLKRKKA